MTSRIKNFKIAMARVLDDNLHTRQWHNMVDWLIVVMILLSTAEIFLSTFLEIIKQYISEYKYPKTVHFGIKIP